MTVITRIGVTERGSFKNTRKRCISRTSKAVHNIKLPLTYSEFTVHMQNQLKAGSFVGTKAGLSHDLQFYDVAHSIGVQNGFLHFFFRFTRTDF